MATRSQTHQELHENIIVFLHIKVNTQAVGQIQRSYSDYSGYGSRVVKLRLTKESD